ncbi:MAG: hypothetical protein NTZ30_05300, partial [Planctomycetota bacterium]|nr:hypothetical protein [Planctomycetota bacterium]
FDFTRARLFTLPKDLKDRLQNLKEETTIVVCQLHKTYGNFTDKPDRYDYAAERLVVGKVKDLVDQLREFGPRFKVVVLDVEEESYERKLNQLTQSAPELRKAIETAPENSIFFWAKKATLASSAPSEIMQRISFNEFYRLDKTSSQLANEGRGNLVLLPQGSEGLGAAEPFVRRILSLDAPKPKVAIAVVDEWLTSKGTDSFGLAGLRKSLESQGFDVKDLILRKLRQRPSSSVAYTFDESKLDRLDQKLRNLNLNLERFDKGIDSLGKMVTQWKSTPIPELEKAYAELLRGGRLSENSRKDQVEYFESELRNIQDAKERFKKQKEEALKERNLLDVDSLIEQQRMTDLEAKMNILLADCDLLIVPRPTLHDVITDDRNLPFWLHGLEKAQINAMQSFIKKGKPVFALLGPVSEPSDQGPVPPGFIANDGFEEMLGKLGFRFGKQTVLFDEEVEGFGEQMAGLLTGGTAVKIPPLLLNWNEGSGRPPALKPNYPEKAHPIRESMRLTARSQSPDKPLELRLRHPRPVYFESPKGMNLVYNPDLFQTSQDSWNENQPFPEMQPNSGERKAPAYNPDDKDPNKGNLDAKRRGPFPVGAAAEVPLPEEWFGKEEKHAPTVRVAVVGESWFLVGPDLPPVKERLVLDVCNWLLGRDDFLPRPSTPWKFPRVELSAQSQNLWLWACQLGLPGMFAYLGFVVLILRRMR